MYRYHTQTGCSRLNTVTSPCWGAKKQSVPYAHAQQSCFQLGYFFCYMPTLLTSLLLTHFILLSLFLCRLTCCWNRMGKFRRQRQERKEALCRKLWVPSRSAIVVNVTVYCRPLLQALSPTPPLPHTSLPLSLSFSLSSCFHSFVEWSKELVNRAFSIMF